MRASMMLALGASLLALEPAAAHACATAPPPGVVVPIADEEALIVWDAATHTEHFIRRATFARAAPSDFGFLVPTPTTPTLLEAPESLFRTMANETAPEIELAPYTSGFALSSLCFMTLGRSVGSRVASDPSVRVLAHAQVGGYDATVLEASDPAALAAWLARRGYDSRPTLREWLAPYVAAGWKLTAFKIAPAGDRPVVTSSV